MKADPIETSHPNQLPSGFRFAATTCGLKESGASDLSLVVSDREITAAGVYTKNQIVAAPVVLSRQCTPTQSFRAVITNSGNANACTGDQGMADALQMTQAVADLVGCSADQVLVMSTGVIGQVLPMGKILPGIQTVYQDLSNQPENFTAVAEAIRTTDDARKITFRQVELSGGTIRIAAMAKGAGMIAPNMATLLSMVMTDASLDPTTAQAVLQRSADASLNLISVDGHTSTNDTLLLLASGNEASLGNDDLLLFEAAVTDALIELGKLIVADGEGAKHFMQLTVEGASDDMAARQIAKTVIESPLVKTAITGSDPNWGRIVSAAGYAGPVIDPANTSLKIEGVLIYDRGGPINFDEKILSEKMSANPEVNLHLTVGKGSGKAKLYASDLSTNYVTFNSEYTT